MSTENLEVKQEPVQEEVQAPQLSPIEQKALEMGWRPKENFDGPEEDFIDAKEFVRRAPLFEKLSQQNRKLRQMEQQLGALQTHYTTVRESEYKRAINALKAERKTAISDGDGEKYEQLSEEISNLEEQAESMKALQEVEQTPQVHPTLQAWINQNSWYTTNSYMRTYAEEVGQRLHRQGLPPEEVLKEVTKAVKKEFPNKFTNPNKETAPNVSEGNKPSNKGSGNSGLASFKAGLSEQELKIMKTLTSQRRADGTPLMTEEKYLQDLKQAKEQK